MRLSIRIFGLIALAVPAHAGDDVAPPPPVPMLAVAGDPSAPQQITATLTPAVPPPAPSPPTPSPQAPAAAAATAPGPQVVQYLVLPATAPAAPTTTVTQLVNPTVRQPSAFCRWLGKLGEKLVLNAETQLIARLPATAPTPPPATQAVVYVVQTTAPAAAPAQPVVVQAPAAVQAVQASPQAPTKRSFFGH